MHQPFPALSTGTWNTRLHLKQAYARGSVKRWDLCILWVSVTNLPVFLVQSISYKWSPSEGEKPLHPAPESTARPIAPTSAARHLSAFRGAAREDLVQPQTAGLSWVLHSP